MTDEIRYQIALNQALHSCPITLKKLLKYFMNAENIIRAKTHTLKNSGLTPKHIHRLQHISWDEVETELEWLNNTTNRFIISMHHELYPNQLKHITAAPYLLYAEGDIHALSKPQLAIVGSRNPTPIGKEIAAEFATALAKQGLIITSGLAIGIDGIAHRATLQSQQQTIAALGCGLKHRYPKRHNTLYNDIVQQGAVISEFPLSLDVHPQHFPRRNRIISGLSLGTLVVQATLRSGSLITATLAAAQGREVFAIPGAIKDPMSRGCHHLIQQGAKLVESVDHILEELMEYQGVTEPDTKKLDQTESHLLECVGYGLSNFEQIVARSGYSVQCVSSVLLNLELHGYIKKLSTGYRRIKI